MDDTTGRLSATSADEDPDLRTREIREEIAQTRADMSETIEAIQERLTPAHLAAQARDTVRHAASEKVNQMANTAGQAADRLKHTSLVETMRSNPIPTAMIGIGAAWLYMKGRSDDGRRDYARYRVGSQQDWRYGVGTEGAVGTSGASGATESYGSTGSYAAELRGGSSRVPEFGGDMREYQRYSSRSRGIEHVVRENPLALGAAAALVGLAIGMSLPATETENRVMGDARDTVVDKAREAVDDAKERVQKAVGLDANRDRSSTLS